MTNEPITQPNKTAQEDKKPKSNLRYLWIILVLVVAWILIRPGIFVIQPIGLMPDGATIIYHSRSAGAPFFMSPDSMCLDMNGEVSLLCRGLAISAAGDLIDRIIFRLPYSHWAYLKSTGGIEFDR